MKYPVCACWEGGRAGGRRREGGERGRGEGGREWGREGGQEGNVYSFNKHFQLTKLREVKNFHLPPYVSDAGITNPLSCLILVSCLSMSSIMYRKKAEAVR